MKPIFRSTQSGVEIIDRIERHRYQLTTHTAPSIESVNHNQIPYPIDAAIRITTDTITLPTHNHIYVRSSDGSLINEVQPNKQAVLPEDEYILDISESLKVYVHVKSSIQIYSDQEQTHIFLDGLSTVVIGARSYHMRPARTITTTSDPEDVMCAVSMFSSALKTITPERSFPTLRGHPPALEISEKLAIPKGLERPNTGIQVEIPPTLRHIFIIAPLAYYLGAEVKPGSKPRLVTNDGYNYLLEKEGGFELTIKRVLRHIFYLDCIVRTEGITPLLFHNRDQIEPVLEFDIESVYEKPLTEQIETYLSVPPSVLEPYLPEEELQVQVKPVSDIVEFLPFIVNSLSPISVEAVDDQVRSSSQDRVQAISEFTRSGFGQDTNPSYDNSLMSESTDSVISPNVKQLWNSSSSSDIISTAPLSAFYNNIGRKPRADPIEIEVVCNDSDMRKELESVNRIYGNREELPFNVTIHYNLTIKEFEEVLAKDSDFLHYIGHIDDDGFQCSDKKLDCRKINSVNIKAFLLNACSSRKQGLHLIRAGSIGGIVTLNDVVNGSAVRIGSKIAKLLNQGFPLYGALDIVRNQSIVGEQYQLVGDGMTTIAQAETEVPNLCKLDKSDGNHRVEMKVYNSIQGEKGSVFTPHLGSVDSYYLAPGKTECISAEETELEAFLNQGRFPVLLNGEIHWSDDLVDSYLR